MGEDIKMNAEIDRIFAAKEQRRKALAALCFPEKIAIIVQLQKMLAPILRGRGREVRVWQIPARTAHSR